MFGFVLVLFRFVVLLPLCLVRVAVFGGAVPVVDYQFAAAVALADVLAVDSIAVSDFTAVFYVVAVAFAAAAAADATAAAFAADADADAAADAAAAAPFVAGGLPGLDLLSTEFLSKRATPTETLLKMPSRLPLAISDPTTVCFGSLCLVTWGQGDDGGGVRVEG